jgi:ankyrin repeat protein
MARERDEVAGTRKGALRPASVLALSALLLVAAAPAESPVADAAQRGDAEAVRSLLRQGADANAPQPDGLTALHWAALNNDVEVVGLLAYAGAAMEPRTRVGGYTPLHLASRSGNANAVGALLEAGADPNTFTTTGVTALHFAAETNSADAIGKLLAHGAEVDAKDSFAERTPLMFAAVGNAGLALSALIEGGADLSLTTRVKDYVTVEAADEAEEERRSRIKEAALDPEPDDEEPAGRGGRGRGANARPGQAPPDSVQADPDSVQADPDSVQADPDSAAADPDSAAEKPAAEPEPAVKALSDIEQIGKQGGFTALHYAARQGHREAARILLDAGADINQVSAGDQSSPLLVALINGNYDLAKELLAAGADPNLVSDDGASPLFATLNIEWSLRTWYPQPGMFRKQQTSYLDLMELLLEAGADPNQRTTTHIWYASYNAGRMGVDFTGATPFWRAAYAADVNAMRLLVDHGADPNVWTMKLPERRRFDDDDDEEEEEEDPSGLPPVPVGGPAVHPLHAASGVGFGTSRVAQQHRSVPDGWLPAVKYLVEELGVDPNLRDMDGYSALHHAAARGDNETILYLVSKGADVTVISRRGQTTADLANSPEQRAQPHPAAVALLEKLGSRNNHQCRTCGTGGG